MAASSSTVTWPQWSKAHNLLDIKRKARHPQSNGIVERFNGTVRAETGDDYGENFLQAQAKLQKMVEFYNEEGLHAALGYMQPAVWHRGAPEQRHQERAIKLSTGPGAAPCDQ